MDPSLDVRTSPTQSQQLGPSTLNTTMHTSRPINGVGREGMIRRGHSDGDILTREGAFISRTLSGERTRHGDTSPSILQHISNGQQDPLEQSRAAVRRAAMIAADRKRRLQETRDDPNRRRSATDSVSGNRDRTRPYMPYLPSGLAFSAASHSPDNQHPQGDSNRPLPSTPRFPASPALQRADFVLPRWQPDFEVSECPICHRTFAFWLRKHHCRKCGRVVCGSCSPHRITIPRQFIVHPPGDLDSDMFGTGNSSIEVVDLTGDDEGNDNGNCSAVGSSAPGSQSLLDPALGGGQEVRLCNPCVPDPNPLPPPAYSTLIARSPLTFPRPDSASSVPHLTHANRGRRDSSQEEVDRYMASQNRSTISMPQRDPFQTPFSPSSGTGHGQTPSITHTHPPPRRPAISPQFYDPNRLSSLLPHQSPTRAPSHPYPFLYGSAPSSTHPLPIPYAPRHNIRVHHRPAASTSAVPMPRYRSMLDIDSPVPAAAGAIGGLGPAGMSGGGVQERQIPEEDECPICHAELPPKGPNEDEADREAHVQRCIESHFSGSAPRPAHPGTEVQAGGTAVAVLGGMVGVGASTDAVVRRRRSSLQGGSAPGPSEPGPAVGGDRVGAPRRRTTGMVVYHASEKDCIGEDGEGGQECVICFEEFGVGDEMGRLECLCKFHKACIRQWWDTKGPGACPVHQGGL